MKDIIFSEHEKLLWLEISKRKIRNKDIAIKSKINKTKIWRLKNFGGMKLIELEAITKSCFA